MKEITFFLDPTSSAASDWRQRAACRDVADPDVFFPIGTTWLALKQIESAKKICRTCCVRAQCLEWALATGQDIGVWGGLSEEERKELQQDSLPSWTRDRPDHGPPGAGLAGGRLRGPARGARSSSHTSMVGSCLPL